MGIRTLTEDYGKTFIEIRCNEEETEYYWVVITRALVVQAVSRVYSSRDHCVLAVRRFMQYLPAYQIRDRARVMTPEIKKQLKIDAKIIAAQKAQINKIKGLLFAGEFGFKTEIGGNNI